MPGFSLSQSRCQDHKNQAAIPSAIASTPVTEPAFSEAAAPGNGVDEAEAPDSVAEAVEEPEGVPDPDGVGVAPLVDSAELELRTSN
jgi:hypothetical protein